MPERVRLSGKSLARYQEGLTLAHRRYDAEAKPKIEKMTKYFLGEQWKPVGGGVSDSLTKLVVNLIFADIKVMLPALALRNPRVQVRPVGATVQIPTMGPTGQPQLVPAQIIQGRPVRVLDAARAQEALVNWRWRTLRVTQAVRRALVDALTAPFGLVKCGYTLQTEKVDLDPEGGGELIEPNELIQADQPYAVRWSPSEFRVDSEARYPDLSDAGWVAFGWKARAEDLRRNPRFKNTRDLKPTIEMRETFDDMAGPGTQGRLGTEHRDDRMRVQCWEIWDKRTQKRLVLADDHDRALEHVDWPAAYANFPCETLYFTEYPDTLYGPPDLWHITGQQDAYNQVASMILNHIKRFLRKYVVTRGAFDEKELAKLMLPVDGQVVEAEASDVAKAIVPVPDAQIPVDWWQTRVNFREDHDRVSGVADFIRGVAEKVDTATEANFIQSNLNVRTSDTRDIVEDFAERIARQLLRIDAQTLDLPASIPVIGPQGAIALGEYRQIQDRDLLLARMDVEVEIGSMQPINPQTRKRDMLELYMLGRNDPLFDQWALREKVLSLYNDSVPDAGSLLLSREQGEQVVQQMMLTGQAPGGPAPGGPRPPRAQAAAGGRPGGPLGRGPVPVRPPESPEEV